MPSIVTIIGIARSEKLEAFPVRVEGSLRLICVTLETDPGDGPMYKIWAGDGPARITPALAAGLGAVEVASSPSTLGGMVTPRPVTNTVRIDPSGAGLDGPFGVPSWLNASAWPRPDPSRVKKSGWVVVTAALSSGKACPWFSAWIVIVVPGTTPNGTMAFTCPSCAYSTGPGTPLKSTLVPPTDMGTRACASS